MQRLRFHYESPTCALDIWAEAAALGSALGQWSAVTAVHPVKFRLKLVSTSGGRSRQVIRGNAQQFMALVTALGETQQQWLGRDDLSLLSDDLGYHLPEQSGLPPLNLSLLQWCDLNDHLDTLNNNVLLLPELEVKVARWHWSWLTILATALALAGVTWATVRVLMPSPQNSPQFSVATRSDPTETPSSELPQKSATSSERAKRSTDDKASTQLPPSNNPSNNAPNNGNSSDGMRPAKDDQKDTQPKSGAEPRPYPPSALPKIALTPSQPTASAPESDRKVAPVNRSRNNNGSAGTTAANPPMSAVPVAPAPTQPEPYDGIADNTAAPSVTGRATRPASKPSIQRVAGSGSTSSSAPRLRPKLGITVQQLGDYPELAKNLEQYLAKYLEKNYLEQYASDAAGSVITDEIQGKITLEITLQYEGSQPKVTKINVISNSLSPVIPARSITAQLLSMIWRWQPESEVAKSQPPSLTVEITINKT